MEDKEKLQEQDDLIISIERDSLCSNVDYRNPSRWSRAKMLGASDPITVSNFSDINYIISSSKVDKVYIIGMLKQYNFAMFGFEQIMKYITPDNLDKLLWIDDYQISNRNRYHKNDIINRQYKPDLKYLDDSVRKYDMANIHTLNIYHTNCKWKTLQYLVWTLLHDIEDKARLYDKHYKDLSSLMYFEVQPSWGYKTITIHGNLDGDRLTNCSDYYLETLETKLVANVFDWLWNITKVSNYKIIPLHVTVNMHTVILIHKSLDKSETLKALKNSMDKQKKINIYSCW